MASLSHLQPFRLHLRSEKYPRTSQVPRPVQWFRAFSKISVSESRNLSFRVEKLQIHSESSFRKLLALNHPKKRKTRAYVSSSESSGEQQKHDSILVSQSKEQAPDESSLQIQQNDEEKDLEASTFPTTLEYLTDIPPKRIDLRPWLLGGFVFIAIFHKAIYFFLDTSILALLRFFCGYMKKSALLSLYVFVNRCLPLVATVTTGTAWAVLIVQGIYAYIVDIIFAKAVVEALVFSCMVFGIAEAVKPDVVNRQSQSLTLAALFGLGGLYGLYGTFIFVSLLFSLGLFSVIVMKKDMLSGTLPIAAVLAAVADPNVRIASVLFFLAIAVYQNWRFPVEEIHMEKRGASYKQLRVMFVLALLAGINAAAKWLYFRHLTWLAK
eukprot:TRINITY_DN33146_c0_g1_i1.p1 TRINITY_DN33146_c0_g1~~TRINITY_DN33146_c0_g1_i1.p1  ORF type:complete len:381 (-),score=52.73 TRINITY_DN33146_c0_g1_i1:166-1308(-)